MSETTKTLTEALIKGKLPDLFTSRGQVTSLNDVTVSGIYSVYNVADAPAKDLYGVLIHVNVTATIMAQLYITNYGSGLYYRNKWGKSWLAWRKVSSEAVATTVTASESGGGNLLPLNAFYAERRAA